MKKMAPLLIICATLLWATMGIVTRYIVSIGFTTREAVALRVFASAVFFLVVLLIIDKRKLKVEIQDYKWFLLTGIGSLFINNLSYATTVQRANLSVAVVLLYTAPFFVMIMSILFFRERVTLTKIFALFLSFIGCTFVVGLTTGAVEEGITVTVLIGLLSGFSYSLYTVIGKILLRKYDSLTVASHTFFVGGVVSVLAAHPVHMAKQVVNHMEYMPLAILGSIVSIACPYILYSIALKYVESSKASIIASVEVVAASIYGVVLYGEKIGFLNVLGIVMVITAVTILQIPGKTEKKIES
ncbi:DME family drug/metabolite transporter [Aequitasia blattaphilus]|uniref:DMT family transporter n=1 Tax=Aequitasia blattaphilus TaxID=2949332 RepID=A0ABT1E5P4_9FIRM|nr:DMT family transporter [Aequitasia blattaphilus]MCP1101073.1 DMT family transporter [Aequitasia blattaphilus]MCR8613713.1 DMT family transporter [Aequitasia blattaphilus]